MHVVGIVGGIASGKSLVAEQLRQLGAEILDADRAGHEVLQMPHVVEAMRRRFGDRILDAGGHIDRRTVAGLVFEKSPAGSANREFLERLTHPEIEKRLQRRLADFASERHIRGVVLDAALLFEAGWESLCDIILFVDVPHHQRLQRARGRGWSEADFAARETVQLPLEEKRRRADVVIDNSSTPEHTFAQVQRFWNSLDQETSGEID